MENGTAVDVPPGLDGTARQLNRYLVFACPAVIYVDQEGPHNLQPVPTTRELLATGVYKSS